MNLTREQWKDVLIMLVGIGVIWCVFEIIALMGGINGFFAESGDPWFLVSLAGATTLSRILSHWLHNRAAAKEAAKSES